MLLRDYQKCCINIVLDYFKNNLKQFVVLPTGSGKTIIFLNIIKKLKSKTLIICPTRDLITQTNEKSKIFFKQSCISAKSSEKFIVNDITILTAHTLNFENTFTELFKHKFDLIIIDECHHSEANTYKNFLHRYRKIYPDFKLLGVTATPERLDGKSIYETFEKLTYEISLLKLIQEKYICDVEAFRIFTKQNFVDKIYGDDFGAKYLNMLDNESRNNIIINTYLENCLGKKTLIFCLNIKHCEKLASSMQKNGLSCKAIHGQLPIEERKYIIEEFRNGKVQVLTNCQLLTEGFDEPSIENLIIARPTKSKALYAQMIGRGLRIYPGKSICSLYELTDNSHKICTFINMNKIFDNNGDITYQKGFRLSKLLKIEICLSDFELVKEKFTLFDTFENRLDKIIND